LTFLHRAMRNDHLLLEEYVEAEIRQEQVVISHGAMEKCQ